MARFTQYLLASAAIFASALAANNVHGKDHSWYNRWDVNVTYNDADYNAECGDGCLANLRGRCGVITDWECDREDSQAFYWFTTTIFGDAEDVVKALQACTYGEQTFDITFEPLKGHTWDPPPWDDD